MQYLTSFIVVAVLATLTSAASLAAPQQLVRQNLLQTLTEEGNFDSPTDLARLKKSAYGVAPPNIPCPKNYLISCQPNVAAVPCAKQGGYAGAYSAPVPTYALPNTHRGIPQEFLRPVPNFNQYLY